jgi:UDP-glucose 4-epimerase
MNILVTGGAGYIGSVVAERLLASGHNPIIYDNLSEGHPSATPEGAELVVAELDDELALKSALREHRADAVIHLAANALVGESMENPSKYFRNNFAAGINLLDAMVECGVRRMVFSSTCAIYGEPESCPIAEDAPKRPSNPYGESKLAFEKALHWYETAHGLRYATLRYFNAAGATDLLGEHHAPETHLIPIALGCALGVRDEVEVYGDDYPTPDGTCIRDYVHVADIANAHILCLDAIETRSRIYNLGTGKGCSVREVIETARRISKRPIPVRYSARRPGDPAELVANPELIKRELGWTPEHSRLDEIIESAWDWHRKRPRGYES